MGFIIDLWLRFNQNRHVRKVTGSKITAFYAALSITYSAIQVIFLAASWQVNHGAGDQVEVMVLASGNGTKEFSYLDYSSGSPQLRLCPGGISHANTVFECPVVWPLDATPAATGQDSIALTYPSPLDISPYEGLMVDGNPPTSSIITLDPDCVQSIKWVYHHLLLLRREDVVAACFHSWLLVMSVTALMNQSIPHIGTSFALHAFALTWSSLQIWATQKFAVDYYDVISGQQGACGTVDVISGYFQDRATYQIATTVVNFVSTIASAFLCWRLFGRYGWATFKKMGASRAISRAYKCALALSICVQLEVFVYISSVGIFLDEISKRLLGANPNSRILFIVGYSITSACVIPWLYVAWYGVRRESKKMMYGFFALSILYLTVSGITFTSNTFQRTFEYWIFIAAAFSLSWALLIAIVILSIICTINFGIGLPHYFERRNGEDAEDYSDDFHPSPDEATDDLEKVSFPSAEVIINFPMQRSESASSYMSQESRGSTRLPPLQVAMEREALRVMIPPPPPNAFLGRDLTASMRSQAPGLSPSWTPGDDRAMMTNQRPLQRFNTASSFGNLDREFSFGTQASSNIIISRTPTTNIIVPANTPQRSLTTSSKSSVSTMSSINSLGTKKRFDLSEEL
jgi:hypothetical protein